MVALTMPGRPSLAQRILTIAFLAVAATQPSVAQSAAAQPGSTVPDLTPSPSDGVPVELGAGIVSLREIGGWLVDGVGDLAIGGAREAAFETRPRVNFGISDAVVWSRFDLRAPVTGQWTLFSRLHKVDRMDAYIVSADGSIEALSAGTETPIASRQWRYRRPAFSFSLSEGEEASVYVAMRGRSRLYRDFSVAPAQRFFDYALLDETFLFFYFGGIAVISLYNLFIYAITKDRNYLLYFLYVFFIFMYQVAVEGYGDAYLWPDWHWFMPRAYNVFIAAAFTLGVLFTRSYLALGEHAPRLNAVGRLLAWVFAATGLASFISTSSWLVNFGTVCVLAGVCYILTSAFFTLHKRYEPAFYYTAAWTALAVGIAVTTSKRIGWLPHTRLTEYALHIANLFEVILLALALGDRVRTQNRRRLEAEEALLDANSRVLQNRMKPHFLFNSMNIIFQQLRESPEAAQATLGLLSDNYHYLTETDGRPLVPLADEWAFLENYLSLMERRWPGQLELTVSLDARLANLPVPPVIIQPLAENAFKYGLRSLERKRLEARADLNDGMVVVTLRNTSDRPLGPVDYSRSLGNIRDRLRRYYPDAVLEVREEGDEVIAELRLAFPGRVAR